VIFGVILMQWLYYVFNKLYYDVIKNFATFWVQNWIYQLLTVF